MLIYSFGGLVCFLLGFAAALLCGYMYQQRKEDEDAN